MNRVRKYLDQKCPKNLSNKRIRLGIVHPQNLCFPNNVRQGCTFIFYFWKGVGPKFGKIGLRVYLIKLG
jgi:hypothetical protein